MTNRYRWCRARGPGGTSYGVMERVTAVPRVTRGLLDAVVFVYMSAVDAKESNPVGATGFLVSYPFRDPEMGLAHLYAVTNSHVALKDGGTRAIRLNKIGGGTETVLVRPDQWHHHDDADVAVAVLDLDQGRMRLADVPTSWFVTCEQIEERQFAEGDECLIIGRHFGLDGTERNTPAARFGSISIMQPEPLHHDKFGRPEESIAVEARSLSGFSGSPVFVWQAPPLGPPVYKDALRGGQASLIGKWEVVVRSHLESPFAFLGLTWGHMNGRRALAGPAADASAGEKALILNSGIMLVVPAWRIRELLETEELAEMRDQAEDDERKSQQQHPFAVSDVGEDDGLSEDRVSLHPAMPEDALRALLRTPPKRDES
jgi:hypothetical protein